ncbi:hypothetical protein NDU88_000830 [Pleurodeles waltl]|uniref:SGNH hydrolase-type esterase domain-containing protein n=1 Tax=Pleurodeles waltl TaxID=8319 RepID=A0AAV7S8C3_PLEWA|nr:hypothetical protein NDU88_000830 [Pleurodeles waltl]
MAPASIWVIGQSSVHRARPFFNLYRSQAQDAGLQFLWIARGVLRLDGLRQLVKEVLRWRLPQPALIILHVGGNDLPTIGKRTVFEDMMVEISWLAKRVSLNTKHLGLWGEAWLVGKLTRPVGGKESCLDTKQVDNLGINKNTSAGELKTVSEAFWLKPGWRCCGCKKGAQDDRYRECP